MMRLLSSILGFSTDKLRTYERSILQAVATMVPPEAYVLLQKQIDAIDRVIRSSKDKEALLGRRRGKQDEFSVETRFPNSGVYGELHLARLRLEGVQPTTDVIADLWSGDGILVAISFNSQPRTSLSKDTFVKECELLANVLDQPLQATVFDTAWLQTSGKLVAEFAAKGQRLTDVVGPAPEKHIHQFTRIWGCQLPADYIRLLTETNGFMLRDWTYPGIHARQVAMPDKNLLLLAEHPNFGVICTQQDDPSKTVFFYDFSAHSLTRVSSQFVEALLTVSQKAE